VRHRATGRIERWFRAIILKFTFPVNERV
jgi:hypothetical protein